MSESIKCYVCKELKDATNFPCVHGKYRTVCKICHAANEKKRRDLMPIEKKRELGKASYDTYKKRKTAAALGELSLLEQINIWIKKNTTRSSEKKFKERNLLCREKILQLCLDAKKKFPQLIFCYVRELNQPMAWIASLDRIDATKGYSDDNIQIIPMWLNSAKLNLTQEEIDDTLFSYVASLPKFKHLLK